MAQWSHWYIIPIVLGVILVLSSVVLLGLKIRKISKSRNKRPPTISAKMPIIGTPVVGSFVHLNRPGATMNRVGGNSPVNPGQSQQGIGASRGRGGGDVKVVANKDATSGVTYRSGTRRGSADIQNKEIRKNWRNTKNTILKSQTDALVDLGSSKLYLERAITKAKLSENNPSHGRDLLRVKHIRAEIKHQEGLLNNANTKLNDYNVEQKRLNDENKRLNKIKK